MKLFAIFATVLVVAISLDGVYSAAARSNGKLQLTLLALPGLIPDYLSPLLQLRTPVPLRSL